MTAIDAFQKQQLRDEGYIVVRSLLSTREVSALVSRLEALWLEEAERAGEELVMEAVARRLANLVNKGDIFRPIIMHPLILAAARLVLGTGVRLSSLNARSVPPHSDPRMPLHEDGIAFAGYAGKPCKMGFNAFTVIWLLDDFTRQNGATRIVPGTHHVDGAPYEVLTDIYGPHPNEVIIEGKAGDVLLFNGHCWHAGGKNTTARQRRAILGLYTRAYDPLQTDHRHLLSADTQAGMTPLEREILGLDDGLVIQTLRKSLVLRRLIWRYQQRFRKPGDRAMTTGSC